MLHAIILTPRIFSYFRLFFLVFSERLLYRYVIHNNHSHGPRYLTTSPMVLSHFIHNRDVLSIYLILLHHAGPPNQ